jgi:hypothetical protein
MAHIFKFMHKQPKEPTSSYAYKMMYSFEKRVEDSKRLREKAPEKVPVIFEREQGSYISDLKNNKMLIPRDTTIGRIMIILRKDVLKIDSNQGLFLFFDNTIIPTPLNTIGEIDDKYKDKDGFLYCKLTAYQTYGH